MPWLEMLPSVHACFPNCFAHYAILTTQISQLQTWSSLYHSVAFYLYQNTVLWKSCTALMYSALTVIMLINGFSLTFIRRNYKKLQRFKKDN